MAQVIKDLQATTYCLTVIEKCYLPYSTSNKVHWYNQNSEHAGIETALGYTMLIAYVIDGRELVKRIEKNFERCKILPKRTRKVSMGPVSTKNIMIAHAFYYTQNGL